MFLLLLGTDGKAKTVRESRPVRILTTPYYYYLRTIGGYIPGESPVGSKALHVDTATWIYTKEPMMLVMYRSWISQDLKFVHSPHVVFGTKFKMYKMEQWTVPKVRLREFLKLHFRNKKWNLAIQCSDWEQSGYGGFSLASLSLLSCIVYFSFGRTAPIHDKEICSFP